MVADPVRAVSRPSPPAGVPSTGPRRPDDDRRLGEAALAGDEEAFAALVDRYQSSLFNVARLHVGSRAVAEEVVQETWIGLLRSLGTFEWRCSLKTWLFTILVRCARRAGERERRCPPVPSAGEGAGLEERFFPAGHRWAGVWRLDRPDLLPTGWESVPEERLLSAETREVVAQAAAALPTSQREVFLLRDVQGCPPEEACAVLDLTANHQRVLLHRARVQVRAALETYLGAGA